MGAPIYKAQANGEDVVWGGYAGVLEKMGGSLQVGGEGGGVCSGADEAYAACGERLTIGKYARVATFE